MAAMSTTGRPGAKCLQEAESRRRSSDSFDDLAWADALEASAGDYLIWFGCREAYRGALRAFFKEWDVLLSPADFVTAFTHTDAPGEERWFDVDGARVPYGWQ